MAHDHHHHDATTHTPKKNLILAASLTGLFCLVEFVGGWYSNSLSLTSDAGHMLIDVGSMLFILLSIFLSAKPASERNTFGYYRLEIIAALINGALLLFVAVEIARHAIGRIETEQTIESNLMLGISSFGLLANLICAKLLHGHHHHIGTRSAYYHVMSDLISSVGVVIAAFLIRQFHWNWIDPVISLFIATLILWNAKKLISSAVHVLLESVPENTPLKSVKETLLAVEGVQGIHDLHIWTIGSGFLSATAHLLVFPMTTLESEQIVKIAAKALKQRYGITHSTFQIESIPAPRGLTKHT